MELAVVEHDLDAHDGEADERPLLDGLAEPLLAGRDELARDHAAHDLVLELEPGGVVRRQWLDVAGHAPVLPAAARLLLVRVVVFAALGDGLAVGHLGLAGDDLAGVLALHALDVDLEVKLAHAADDGLG